MPVFDCPPPLPTPPKPNRCTDDDDDDDVEDEDVGIIVLPVAVADIIDSPGLFKSQIGHIFQRQFSITNRDVRSKEEEEKIK